MRVAHFSDLHILALDGVSPLRLLNKRLTGWVNLRLKREHKHRPAHVRAVAREIARSKVDHVVITGDLTNLALDEEFQAVLRLIEEELGLDVRGLRPPTLPDPLGMLRATRPASLDRTEASAHVTILPGNHDLYTRGAMRSRRFTRFFAPYLESDLPELAAELPLGRFPFVKLRGPLAIIGMTSAVPRLPLVASGKLGDRQLEALCRILAHDEVKRRTPVIAMHHPIHNPTSPLATFMRGLDDAKDLEDAIGPVARGLLLHGHLHERVQKSIATKAGSLLSVGATSASLEHEDEHRMAGFNLYEFDGAGALVDVAAHVLDSKTGSFRVDSVPKWL